MSFDVVMNADTARKIVIPAAVALYGKWQLKLRVIVFPRNLLQVHIKTHLPA